MHHDHGSSSSRKPYAHRRDSSSSQHHYHHHRQSSSSSRNQQRPRLLRSSATEPSVTPSDEMQASLVAPNSPHTAADLLTRMAYVPPSSYDLGQPLTSSGSSSRSGSSVAEPIMIEKRVEGTDMSTPENSVSECYFSFPNFDNWETPSQDGDKQSYT